MAQWQHFTYPPVNSKKKIYKVLYNKKSIIRNNIINLFIN